MKLIIRRYTYLKSPYFNWTLVNDVGGSFSNSGGHTSRLKCIRHFLSQNPEICREGRELLTEFYDVNADGDEIMTGRSYVTNPAELGGISEAKLG